MKKQEVVKMVMMLILAVTLPLWAGPALLAADDETGREGVKKYGIVHNIAEDRRVEKVGGLYEPEGLDIYMKRHMDALEAQVRGLESKMDTMNKKMDEVSGLLNAMNENLKKSPASDNGKKRL